VPPLRWWNTLTLRLALVFNAVAVGVLGAFWVVDCRHEYTKQLNIAAERLGEEARILSAARSHFTEVGDFQEFLDTFCRQMSPAVSPGHHIVMFGPSGEAIAPAHVRSQAGLEGLMAATRAGASAQFSFDGLDYLSVSAQGADGARVVIAQSLAPIWAALQTQAGSRALSLAVVAALVIGITTITVLVLVRDPLRQVVAGIQALGRGRFDVRLPRSRNPVLRYVAERINEMARALHAVDQQRRAEMKRARAIQSRLLPPEQHAIGVYDIAAKLYPADSVGGDLYDIVRLEDGSTLLAILDVAGHGVAAALYTALLQNVLHYEARATADPARLLDVMNAQLARKAGGSGDFATCFLVRLDRDTGAIDYAGAGHEPVVLVRSSGAIELLESGGPPLGLIAGNAYAVGHARLESGDRLLLYTDGLHEIWDGGGRHFGREKLIALLGGTARHEPAAQVDAVIEAVRRSARDSRFVDDVTLICALRTAAAADKQSSILAKRVHGD